MGSHRDEVEEWRVAWAEAGERLLCRVERRFEEF
jgi:hypothetical protein